MKPRQNVLRNILPTVSDTHWALMRDAELPEGFSRWQNFTGVPRALWDQCRAEVLHEWTRERPGTRPSYWWKFDAPRWSPEQPGWEDWHSGLDLCAPRLRLSGKGTACHDAFAYLPHFEMGLPTSWVDDFYFEDSEDNFIAERFDPNDPPLFESQATYLKRLGLLMPGELRRIPKAAFLPEQITWKE